MLCRRALAVGFGASIGLGALPAAAQESAPPGQGIAGGALVATELTLLGEAVAGVEPVWAYALGGTLAAAAGGYAGYLIERDAEADVSAWLLAGGLVALIPTVIWVGNAREMRRHPDPPPRVSLQSRSASPPFESRAALYVPLVRGVF